MTNNQEYFDKKANELLNKLKVEQVSSPLYLKTRVLARLKEQRDSKGAIFMWKKFTILSSSLAVVALITLFTFYSITNGFLKAYTGKPFLVRIEAQDIDKSQIAFAKIELPKGVEFFSKKFPEINKERILVLDWENGLAKNYLPFIIEGKEVGKKILKISFLSKEMQIVAIKEFKVNFQSKI